MINISYLQADKPLKDNMFITAKPLYKNINIDFFRLHRIVKSDKVQYTPFYFENSTKKSENWNNGNQNLLILDIDDGFTIEEARNKFRQYKYLICTTKSHQVEKKGLRCDRFRIILESDNIPKGEDYFIFTQGLEILYPFIDKQVNTKTGAFLGFGECEYWYNDGTLFDCSDLFQVSKEIVKQREEAKIKKPKREINPDEEINVQDIKDRLNREIIADILNAHGFEVDRNFKLKLRSERTPSTSISVNGLIKDFGSDFSSDVIGVLMEYRGMNFKEAVNVVSSYV